MRFLAIGLILLAGCAAAPRTQVVVQIFAEPGVMADAESIHITVLGGARGATLTSQADQVLGGIIDAIEWPVTVALVPAGDDPERLYVVQAEATNTAGATLGIVRARSSYVAGQTLVLRLTLEECCRTVACSAEQTCRSCACATAEVPVESLPDYRSDASTHPDGGSDATDAAPEIIDTGLDAPMSMMDAGSDAGRDAGSDAGTDAPLPAGSCSPDAGCVFPRTCECGETQCLGPGEFCL